MTEIEVTVKLFAQYREGKFKVEQRRYPENTVVDDVIAETGINIERYPIGVMIINGRHVQGDRLLEEGDALALFPKVGGG
jgi:molybdopterin converting factor small subunit